MKWALTSYFVLAALVTVSAQPVAKVSDRGTYAIPYASESNRIELEVLNSTSHPLKDVSLELGPIPIWLTFETTTASLGVLKPGKSEIATFTFTLDEKAPVGEVTDLNFNILSATGLLESRTIKVEPEAPTEFMLRANYPNPFNPTTNIAYALPKDGNVRIEIFNSIGQRVARIVDGIQKTRQSHYVASDHLRGNRSNPGHPGGRRTSCSCVDVRVDWRRTTHWGSAWRSVRTHSCGLEPPHGVNNFKHQTLAPRRRGLKHQT